MEQKQNRIASGVADNEALQGPVDKTASSSQLAAAPSGLTDFEPVPLRHRHDGLTPERQREYVEALADCGVARRAAEREQRTAPRTADPQGGVAAER